MQASNSQETNRRQGAGAETRRQPQHHPQHHSQHLRANPITSLCPDAIGWRSRARKPALLRHSFRWFFWRLEPFSPSLRKPSDISVIRKHGSMMAESEAETPSTPIEFESKYFEYNGVRLPPFCRGKMEEIANFSLRSSDIWIVTYPKSGNAFLLTLHLSMSVIRRHRVAE